MIIGLLLMVRILVSCSARTTSRLPPVGPLPFLFTNFFVYWLDSGAVQVQAGDQDLERLHWFQSHLEQASPLQLCKMGTDITATEKGCWWIGINAIHAMCLASRWPVVRSQSTELVLMLTDLVSWVRLISSSPVPQDARVVNSDSLTSRTSQYMGPFYEHKEGGGKSITKV